MTHSESSAPIKRSIPVILSPGSKLTSAVFKLHQPELKSSQNYISKRYEMSVPKIVVEFEGGTWESYAIRPPVIGEVALNDRGVPQRCTKVGHKDDRIIMRPVPQYQPWTFETMPYVVKAKFKADSAAQRTFMPINDETVLLVGHGSTRTYAELLENWIRLDGRPCGTPVR